MDGRHFPIDIIFRHVDSSESIREDAYQRALKLAHFSDEIMHCQVVIENHHHHQNAGNLYHVRIDLKISGTSLVVNRDPDKHLAHKDVYVAIRDAFEAMTRQLQNHASKKRSHVRHHKDHIPDYDVD